jgi:hypothetical protein
VYLKDNGRRGEEFEFDRNGFRHQHDEIAAWLDDSRYAVRPAQIEWLKEASPFDAGARVPSWGGLWWRRP